MRVERERCAWKDWRSAGEMVEEGPKAEEAILRVQEEGKWRR